MTVSEAQRRADKKYEQKIRRVVVKFDTTAEGDVLAFLESKNSMQAYLKALVKEDMYATKIYRVEDAAGEIIDTGLTYCDCQMVIARLERRDKEAYTYREGSYRIRNTMTGSCERVVNVF